MISSIVNPVALRTDRFRAPLSSGWLSLICPNLEAVSQPTIGNSPIPVAEYCPLLAFLFRSRDPLVYPVSSCELPFSEWAESCRCPAEESQTGSERDGVISGSPVAPALRLFSHASRAEDWSRSEIPRSMTVVGREDVRLGCSSWAGPRSREVGCPE